MSVVLLEQLLETFNNRGLGCKLEVYECVLPTAFIEVGVVDTVTNTSHVKVLGKQSKELSYTDVVNQGASMLIDCIFAYGLSKILKDSKVTEENKNYTRLEPSKEFREKYEKLEEGSGELRKDNIE